MLIQNAHAQDIPVPAPTTSTTGAPATPVMPQAPSALEAFAWNMGMVLVLVVLFYVMLIKPQQRRLQEHNKMLTALKKGDKVIASGGLLGTIDRIDGNDEAVVDLGNGIKVTVLKNSLQPRK